MNRFLLLMAICVFGLEVSVANGPGEDDRNTGVNITGKVIDHETREALSGVAVKLDGFNKTVYSDFDGNFSFTNLYPGKYDISITYPAYREIKIEKLPVHGNQKEKEKEITVRLSSIH